MCLNNQHKKLLAGCNRFAGVFDDISSIDKLLEQIAVHAEEYLYSRFQMTSDKCTLPFCLKLELHMVIHTVIHFMLSPKMDTLECQSSMKGTKPSSRSLPRVVELLRILWQLQARAAVN